jgi:hypothetical protein
LKKIRLRDALATEERRDADGLAFWDEKIKLSALLRRRTEDVSGCARFVLSMRRRLIVLSFKSDVICHFVYRPIRRLHPPATSERSTRLARMIVLTPVQLP